MSFFGQIQTQIPYCVNCDAIWNFKAIAKKIMAAPENDYYLRGVNWKCPWCGDEYYIEAFDGLGPVDRVDVYPSED